MLKFVWLVVFCFSLLVFGATTSNAAVYPDVQFSFNAGTWEYSWTITCPVDSTYAFGQFTVDAMVPQVWTAHSGPWTDGGDQAWEFISTAPRSDGNVSFWWRANTSQEVIEGALWTGVFKVIAPNTTPVSGKVQTKDGAILSRHTITSFVPGPVVPEPSSLLVLGASVGGMLPFIMRRRK